MKIKTVHSREILDSRGVPTISTEISLEDGTKAKGEVPSGASTGKTEVHELRDNDPKRYFGKGVLSSVDIVNTEIANAVIGKEFKSQEQLDNYLIELDGTELKSRLGGNSILSLSMAFCRASAKSMGKELYEYFAEMYHKGSYAPKEIELPMPQILILEGGKHGNWATDFQEYMVMPQERFKTFAEKLRAGAEVFKATHDILVSKNYSATVGFEGAFAPIQMKSNPEAFDIILEGIQGAGFEISDFKLAIDIASSEFYEKEKGLYILKREGVELDTDHWLELQEDWYEKYPIWSIEDGLDQEDWLGWQKQMSRIGSTHQIVGDDLLTTNVSRIKKAIDTKSCNSVLIKLNQIGTVTETLDAIRMAVEAGMSAVISHRAGETNDDMVADLVVGTPANQSKFGGPDRGERLAKYNRLLEIEERLGL
jgi:enolase